MLKPEIDDEIKEGVQACIPKKNAIKCIEKFLQDHNIPLEQKDEILIEIIKNNIDIKGSI